MIKCQNLKKGKKVKVTFVLPVDVVPSEELAVSVVGSFNDWSLNATPLKKRSNGMWSAAMELDPGEKYAFRYYSADGSWLNDEAADAYEPSGYGSDNCIVLS